MRRGALDTGDFELEISVYHHGACWDSRGRADARRARGAVPTRRSRRAGLYVAFAPRTARELPRGR